jgi:outer membrane protein
MTNEKIKLWGVCLILCSVFSGCVYWLVTIQQKKVAVVNAVKLVEEFNMKKELEEIAKHTLILDRRVVDSFGNALELAQTIRKDNAELIKLANELQSSKNKLENDYSQSNREINEQVWKRLNPLLEEFGKKNGFHLIIGANGMGSVLFTDDYYDRTNDAIKFINKKYAEGN